jgi:hypothetical protein
MTDLIIKAIPCFPGNPNKEIIRFVPGKTLVEFVKGILAEGEMGERYLNRIVSIEVRGKI